MFFTSIKNNKGQGVLKRHMWGRNTVPASLFLFQHCSLSRINQLYYCDMTTQVTRGKDNFHESIRYLFLTFSIYVDLKWNSVREASMKTKAASGVCSLFWPLLLIINQRYSMGLLMGNTQSVPFYNVKKQISPAKKNYWLHLIFSSWLFPLHFL